MVSISSLAFFSSYISISGVPEYSMRFSVPCDWCAAAPPIPILESPSSSTEPFRAPPIAELLVLIALPGRKLGPFLAAFAAPKAGGLVLLAAARFAFDPPTILLAVLRVLEPGTLLY